MTTATRTMQIPIVGGYLAGCVIKLPDDGGPMPRSYSSLRPSPSNTILALPEQSEYFYRSAPVDDYELRTVKVGCGTLTLTGFVYAFKGISDDVLVRSALAYILGWALTEKLK